jgi:dihydrofolate reductase
MLRVVMAVSNDGFVARDDQDNMKWTGQEDKNIFRVLTGIGGDIAVGRTTFDQMPELSGGRRLICVSRDEALGISLSELFQLSRSRPVWLAGGQTVVMSALRHRMIREVHISRLHFNLSQGIKDSVTPYLKRNSFVSRMFTYFDTTTVERWLPLIP